MSTSNPISPTSPMDVSPITQIAMQQQLGLPETPVLSPSFHLPRLVTSFQNLSSDPNSLKKMSIQFQLPSPSPLSLRQTPLTVASFPDLTTVIVSTASSSPIGARATPAFLSATKRIPALQRRNAMEGLEDRQSPITKSTIGQGVHSTLRINTTPLDGALAKDIQPSSVLKKTCPNRSASRTTVARPSSIARKTASSSTHRRTHIGQVARTPTTKLIIKSLETAEQRYIKSSIAHLSCKLQPLISVRTGQEHPEFPMSILQYHLLTHEQLDILARHYHQTIDAGVERWMYPCPIGYGKVWCGSSPPLTDGRPRQRHLVDLETKRRRWGRFIGLRGCESPVLKEDVQESEPIEDFAERIEREWIEALRRAEEEARVREKSWRGRF